MTHDTDTTALSSAQLWARAQSVLAGGVSHEYRGGQRAHGPHPQYIARARGARKWDVEGTEYIDYAMGSAALLLGHAHPAVVAAVREQMADGTFFAACHPLEVAWGALVQAMLPSAERVRFCASGTEATMLAIRIARAYSGRDRLLRFEGHFHGWHDSVAPGMTAPYDAVPTGGVPAGTAAATVVCPPDPERVEAMLATDPDIGAIICEASGANYGAVPLPDGFLAALRDIADKREVVLIFDEVITGFRWSPGGAQALEGVTPDLTTLAKILTGGMPGGAVAGKAAFMRLLDPSVSFRGRKPAVIHRGTFNGNPMVAAGAIAALKIAQTGAPQAQADRIAKRLRQGMQTILDEHQVAGAVYGQSSTFHVYLGPCEQGSVAGLGAAQIRSAPKQTVAAYQAALRRRGVDFMSYLGGVTSAAHTDADVAPTLEAFEGAIRELIESGLIGAR